MHIEIQVALNFIISYLYNKLPRRRVNLFGDELEKALKKKFEGHWYPELPFKGSAFRCLKTGERLEVSTTSLNGSINYFTQWKCDQVFEIAAKESGITITDILENLPHELSVWVDPGEVSYRIGEKGSVQILYSENHDANEDSYIDKEVTKTFKPDAQCFRPIEAVAASLSNLNITPKATPHPTSTSSSPMFKNNVISPTIPSGFMNRSSEPIKFTTATFAQTKFGSTKLKNNVKKTNRMSPTEFSNYLKQKALHQQYHHSNNLFTPVHHHGHLSVSPTRSMSPNSLNMNLQNDPYILTNMGMNIYPQLPNVSNTRNVYETPTPSYADAVIFTPINANNSSAPVTTSTTSLNTAPMKDNKLVDNYHSNQGSSYQHLLVAN